MNAKDSENLPEIPAELRALAPQGVIAFLDEVGRLFHSEPEIVREAVYTLAAAVGGAGDPVDRPAWVLGAARSIAKEILPGSDRWDVQGGESAGLGTVLGFGVGLIKRWPHAGSGTTASDPDHDRILTTLLELSSALILHESPDSAEAYLEGFSTGFKASSRFCPPFGGPSSNFLIYLYLLFKWRDVSGFKSTKHLQQELLKYLPKNVVGDHIRVKKLCQRLNLKFRAKGRPKKETSSRRRVAFS